MGVKLDTLTILLNVGYFSYFVCYMSKDILWLRVFVIVGALCSLPYYYYLQDKPIWNVIGWASLYISINLVQLLFLYLQRRPIKLTEIEQGLYDLVFDSLPPRTFRNVFKLGSFEELEQNTLLIKSDEYIDKLYLIVEGEAQVTLPNGSTRMIRKGGFIGEQSFITHNVTSADVRISTEKTLLLTWETATLRRFLDKDLALSNTFDLIITSDIINKLRRMA